MASRGLMSAWFYLYPTLEIRNILELHVMFEKAIASPMRINGVLELPTQQLRLRSLSLIALWRYDKFCVVMRWCHFPAIWPEETIARAFATHRSLYAMCSQNLSCWYSSSFGWLNFRRTFQNGSQPLLFSTHSCFCLRKLGFVDGFFPNKDKKRGWDTD